MDAKQESHFNMMRTVRDFLTANGGIIATIPALPPLLTELDTRNADITAVIILQGKPISGIVIDKGDLKTAMCKITSKLAGAAMAYARSTGNDTLHEALNFSFSDLMRERDDEAGPRCAGVLLAMNEVAAALVAYGVTTVKLTECADAIEAYIAAVPSVRTAEVARSVETEKLENLLRENSLLLSDKIDGLVKLLEDDEPDFVSGYFKSRELIDPKHFSTALRISVVDSESDLEIANALMTISETGEVINGDASGIILWKPATQGDQLFVVSADGYQPHDGSVHLTVGTETFLEVRLVRVV